MVSMQKIQLQYYHYYSIIIIIIIIYYYYYYYYYWIIIYCDHIAWASVLLEAWGKRGAQLPFADHCIACMCVGGGNRCLHPEVHEQTEKIDDVTLPSPLNHPCINFRLFEPGASRVRLLYPPLIFPFTHLALRESAGLRLRQ